MAELSQLQFLVVDDMLTMRKIVSQQLKALGVTQITEANDGSTAWQVLEAAAATPDRAPKFIVSEDGFSDRSPQA